MIKQLPKTLPKEFSFPVEGEDGRNSIDLGGGFVVSYRKTSSSYPDGTPAYGVFITAYYDGKVIKEFPNEDSRPDHKKTEALISSINEAIRDFVLADLIKTNISLQKQIDELRGQKLSKPKVSIDKNGVIEAIKHLGYNVEYGDMVDGLYGFISASTNRVFVSIRKTSNESLRFLVFAEYLISKYGNKVMDGRELALYVRDDLFCLIDESILKDCISYVNHFFGD